LIFGVWYNSNMAEEGRFSKNVKTKNTKKAAEPKAEPRKEEANKWLVVVGLILTGLLIGGGLVFAGYRLTQQRVPEFEEFEELVAEQVVPPSSPSAEPATEAEPEAETPLADWETYTNAAYGYQFQHPADWSFSIDVTNEDPGTELYVICQGVQSDEIDEYTAAVRVWDNPDELFLADWIQFMKDSNAFAAPTEDMDTSANTQVGGEDALQFWSDPLSGGAEPGECVQSCPTLSVYFVHGDKAYAVQLNYLREFDEDSFILFSQVLSTFEFL